MSSRAVTLLIASLLAAVVVIAGVVCCRLYVLIPYRVPTVGMFPTVHQNGLIWAYQLAYSHSDDVRRGDVIAYRTTFQNKPDVYLKRVVGIPGDRIRIASGALSINGAEIPRHYLRAEESLSIYQESLGAVSHQIAIQVSPPPKFQSPEVDVVVPADSFFVLGDNRTNSLDSRYTGFVAFPDVIGRKL